MKGKSGRLKWRILAGCVCITLSACATRVGVPTVPGMVQSVEALTLYSHPMELRLSKPAVMTTAPLLVVYATGDGGWRGVDGEIFDWIASSGVPIAGFSSRNYLKNLGYFSQTDTTTTRRLVRDYRRIIEFARSKLNLPRETQILLAGNSRGAGLAVSAAGPGELKDSLAGVLAIALTKEEEHVLHRVSRHLRASGASTREQREVKTYDYLPRLTFLPVCVIQSTNDKYVPADEARLLFGPDGELRRLRSIEARSHSFSGGHEKLRAEVISALDWVAGAMRHHPAPPAASESDGH